MQTIRAFLQQGKLTIKPNNMTTHDIESINLLKLKNPLFSEGIIKLTNIYNETSPLNLAKHLGKIVYFEEAESNIIRIKLEKKQGYILQNRRWLHGRTAFEGTRTFNKLHINLSSESINHLGFIDFITTSK